jgi:hemerythrin
MPTLEWKPEYQTGIAGIDYEHRRLVDTINSICDNLAGKEVRDDVLECLGQLYERICTHFALEENMMQERQYPLYSGHKAQHTQLLEHFRTMMDAYEDGDCERCGKTLDECLISWFSQHFQTGHGVPIHFGDRPA